MTSSEKHEVRLRAHVCARRVIVILGVSIGLLLISLPLFSQGGTGGILGSVTDQTGGVIVGATVTIADTQRGITRTLTTDQAGEYSAPGLIAGTYSVRVEARGFRPIERQNITIEVGSEVRVDLSVQPGEQSQTITVTEALPMVETTNAELGGTLSNQIINDLPLNGRNFNNLLVLRPGVFIYPGGGFQSQSTNGLRSRDNVFILGGIVNDEPWSGQSIVNEATAAGDVGTIVPIDAIQEFKTEVNPRAEYGWKPGAVINVGIKSGTNSLHGTAYAFGRDTAFDARNFFNPVTQPKAPVGLEQFGGTVGGPLKKDKLFYFTSYEGQLYDVGVIYQITAPVTCAGGSAGCGLTTTNAAKSLVDACNSVPAAKRTALSLRLAGLNPNCSPAAGFPNLFPANNGTFNATDPATIVPGFTSTSWSHNGLAKIDYRLNDHHTLNGMFFFGESDGIWNDASNETQPAWLTNEYVRALVGSVNWSWIPNSTWVNELRGGYDHYYESLLTVDSNVNPTSYGINTGVTNPVDFGFPPLSIQPFSGTLGGGWPKIVGPVGVVHVVDNLSMLRGHHAFKFGGEVMFNRFSGTVTSSAKGNFGFQSSGSGATAQTALQNFFLGVPASASLLLGDAFRQVHNEGYAAFVQDDWRIKPRLILNLGVRYEVNTVLKESNNLIGSFDPAQGLVQVGRQINNPYTGDHNNFSPRIGFAWDVQGNGKTVVRAGASIIYEQLSYDLFIAMGNLLGLRTVPTGATIVKNGVATPGSGNIGLASFSFPAAGLSTIATNWANNGPNTALFPATSAVCGDGSTNPLTGFPTTQCTGAGVDRNLRTPYVENWTLDLQRAITNNVSLEVGYVANHGVKLIQYRDINQPPLGAGWFTPFTTGKNAGQTAAAVCLASAPSYGNCSVNAAPEQAAKPFNSQFPYLTYIDMIGNLATSNYNGLQTILTARNYHGLSATVGYTYSHAIDTSSGGGIPLDSTNPKRYRGSSTFDVRQRGSISTTYAFPGKKSPGQILQGWQINSVVQLQSGTPWDPTETADDFSGTNERRNSTAERWDFFGNPGDFTTVHGFTATNGIPYFPGTTNAACLAQAKTLDGGAGVGLAQASLTNLGCYALGSSILIPPPYGSYGTMGRDILRNSGFKDWDLSVTKDWKFKDRLTAQFRAEVFNILNHPIFANPGRGIPDANPAGAQFGCGCNTPDQAAQNPVLGAGGPRAMQLGLKLIF